MQSEHDYSYELNKGALTTQEENCSPSMYLNLSEAFESTPEERQSIPKYYGSRILGIYEDTEILSHIFTNPLNSNEAKSMFERFEKNAIQLLQMDDICDNVGIKYLAKIIKLGYSGTELNFESKRLFQAIIQTNTKIVEKAKKL